MLLKIRNEVRNGYKYKTCEDFACYNTNSYMLLKKAGNDKERCMTVKEIYNKNINDEDVVNDYQFSTKEIKNADNSNIVYYNERADLYYKPINLRGHEFIDTEHLKKIDNNKVKLKEIQVMNNGYEIYTLPAPTSSYVLNDNGDTIEII